MTAKALAVIFRKPYTDTMNHIAEQMTKMVAAVKMTAWGGKHRFLALVLENANYRRLIRDQLLTTDWLDPPTATVTAGTIHFTSTPFDITTFKEAQKTPECVRDTRGIYRY